MMLSSQSARLQLKDPSKIINIRPFRTSPEETKNFNKHIQKLQAQNIVEDAYSIFNNPLFLAQKSDGSQRLLGDFRKLNENLVKVDSFLPRIDTFLDNLRGSNFLSVCDFRSGYFQIPLTEDSRDLTSFSTTQGKKRFTVLPQGVAPAPAIFNICLNYIFAELHVLPYP